MQEFRENFADLYGRWSGYDINARESVSPMNLGGSIDLEAIWDRHGRGEGFLHRGYVSAQARWGTDSLVEDVEDMHLE